MIWLGSLILVHPTKKSMVEDSTESGSHILCPVTYQPWRVYNLQYPLSDTGSKIDFFFFSSISIYRSIRDGHPTKSSRPKNLVKTCYVWIRRERGVILILHCFLYLFYPLPKNLFLSCIFFFLQLATVENRYTCTKSALSRWKKIKKSLLLEIHELEW